MTQEKDWGTSSFAGALYAVAEANDEEDAFQRARASQDREAFDRLFALISTRILRRAYKQGIGSPEEAEDAFSQAALDLFKKDRAKWPPTIARFEYYWLRMIAYRTLNLVRSRLRRREDPLEGSSEHPVQGDFTRQVHDRDFLSRRLPGAINALLPQEAEVFRAAVTAEEQGLSQGEAATAVGLEYARFRSLLHSARGKLRRHLRQE